MVGYRSDAGIRLNNCTKETHVEAPTTAPGLEYRGGRFDYIQIILVSGFRGLLHCIGWHVKTNMT